MRLAIETPTSQNILSYSLPNIIKNRKLAGGPSITIINSFKNIKIKYSIVSGLI